MREPLRISVNSPGELRDIVLNDDQPHCRWRWQSGETQLFVEDVTDDGRRYVVCRNEKEVGNGQAKLGCFPRGPAPPKRASPDRRRGLASRHTGRCRKGRLASEV